MNRFVVACVLILVCHSAHAGSATSSVTANKTSPLKVITVGVTADCTWPAGTVVLAIGTTGGDGNAVTYTLGGTPSGDFAISGANLVIGPNGVAATNCGKVESVTINASQQ